MEGFISGSCFMSPGSIFTSFFICDESNGSLFIPDSNLIAVGSIGSFLIVNWIPDDVGLEDEDVSIIAGGFGRFWLGNLDAKSAATYKRKEW